MRLVSRIVKKVILWFFILSIGGVILYRFAPVYFTPLMIIRSVQAVIVGESPKIKHKWVSYDNISTSMKRAVIASEDQRFVTHNGFDTVEINKALEENKNRKKARGASTISQQTAKNVFLWPQSSWVRKGFEVYFTFLIELIWSKERILEVYLNSIEMGKGIYGAEAVAHANFNTTASELSKSQAATIAATLPNPIRFDSANPSRYINRRKSQIMKQMSYVQLP